MRRLSLHKISFHLKALIWESIILLVPPTTRKAYPIAILEHGHCAIYASPPTPLLYAIHNIILVMAISCKGQAPTATVAPTGMLYYTTKAYSARLVWVATCPSQSYSFSSRPLYTNQYYYAQTPTLFGHPTPLLHRPHYCAI